MCDELGTYVVEAFVFDEVGEYYCSLKRAGHSTENIHEDSFKGEKMFFDKDTDGQPIEIYESVK